ncbi:GNAT family N-acetyltransferase [Streptomyces tendae]|uniref:GNAT family N-acetyltransferase n=1 Tax=Streptomyces tendae TaxID=1932 RepID=UPI003664D06F
MTASDTAVTVSHQPEPQTDFVLTDTPTPEDIAAISDALDRFNIEHTGIADRRPLAVLVRDPDTRQVVGGLTGRTSLGLFFLDLFYLPPWLRGSGLGTEILRQAEDEARARGCRTAVLYTITFQARLLPETRVEVAGRGALRSAGHQPRLHDQRTHRTDR